MGARTWIKIYCDNWLDGTLRQESLELRGAWVEVLVLAGKSNYGDAGEIKLTKKIGLTDEIIASIMEISTEKWREIKAKLIKTGRIRVLKGNIIKVVKWHKYQSEYERQKPYREKESNQKLQNKVTDSVTQEVTQEIEKEIEIEKKNIKKGVTLTKKQEQLFTQFWEAYPYKKSKGQAEKAWKKINPNDDLFDSIIEGLNRAKKSINWTKDNGEYIPYPATWLNARGWEDEDVEILGESQGTRMTCKVCGDDSQHVSIGEDNLCALCRGKEYDGRN